MALTAKKVSTPTIRQAEIEYRMVDDHGTEVARVYKRQTVKTGFKRGLCVGQVPVKGWFFRLASSPNVEFGKSEGMIGGPKWASRTAALEGLNAELLKALP